MPNGGMLPCCSVCDHGESDSEGYSVECTVHDMEVHLGMGTFCTELSMYGKPQKPAFADLSDEMIYAWIEIAFPAKENPTLPQYHHQFEPLDLISEYKNWSLADHSRASQALYRKVKRGFFDQSDSE